jgi:histone-lysine N-methyltransferase ASH1L
MDYWRTYNFKETSMCICTPETGCDEDCQNRHMFYECDKHNCALPPELCKNRNFVELGKRYKKATRNKYDVGVDVLPTADKGFGLRSNRSFEPGQIIIEYCGEIITQEEAERRMTDDYKNAEVSLLLSFNPSSVLI